MSRLLPALVSLLVLVACDSSGTAGDVALGTEFTLAPGQSVTAGDDGLRVRFEGVAEDSRCPKDAICIWSGQVIVEVTTGRDGARHSLKPDETATVDGYRLKLVRVEPYPSSEAPIEPSQYRATFVVLPM